MIKFALMRLGHAGQALYWGRHGAWCVQEDPSIILFATAAEARVARIALPAANYISVVEWRV